MLLHDVLININLIIGYIDFFKTTYILMCKIKFIIKQRNEGLICYTSVKARYKHQNNVTLLHTQIKKHEITFIASLHRRVGQDRNCH